MTKVMTTHPIRTSGPLDTPTDFEQALEYALQGDPIHSLKSEGMENNA